MFKSFTVEKTSEAKLLLNTNLLMDIPNGNIVTGAKGEKIINGGISQCTAVVGRGNLFKSTLLLFLAAKSASIVARTTPTGIHVNDTEINMQLSRITDMARRAGYLNQDEHINDDTGKFVVTDKSNYPADIWMGHFRKFQKERMASKDIEFTAFRKPGTKEILKYKAPNIAMIDSFTEFEPSVVSDMLDNAKDVYGKELNMLNTKQGMYKTVITGELSRTINQSNTYLLLTAHVGDFADYSGGFGGPPPKLLGTMKATDKIKGVGTKFSFLVTTLWQVTKAKNLFKFETKESTYPKDASNPLSGAKDLYRVTMEILRSKFGETETTISYVVSQKDGILETVSKLDNLLENKMYGLTGKGKYTLDLDPTLKVTRRNVRTPEIEDSKVFNTILTLTSDLLQYRMHQNIDDIYLTPKELHEKLLEKGYKMEDFYNTRPYYLIDQYSKSNDPFCSVLDLLEFARGIKKPYWFNKEQLKNIKE